MKKLVLTAAALALSFALFAVTSASENPVAPVQNIDSIDTSR